MNLVGQLKEAYDDCVLGLQVFRTGHITLVADYIMVQQKKDTAEREAIGGMEKSAGGKGTGGTDLMNFLKPIRDDCTKTVIDRSRTLTAHARAEISSSLSSSSSCSSNATASASVSAPAAVSEVLNKGVNTITTTAPSSQQLPSDKREWNGYSFVSDNSSSDDDVYQKDVGDPEDIDLYRGGYSTTASSLNKINEFRVVGLSALKNLSVAKLSAIISYSSNLYYNSAPLLSDSEYEMIKEYQRRKAQEEMRGKTGGKDSSQSNDDNSSSSECPFSDSRQLDNRISGIGSSSSGGSRSSTARGCMMMGGLSMPGAYGNFSEKGSQKGGSNDDGGNKAINENNDEVSKCPYAPVQDNGTYQ